jgi:hypothetical protein
MRDGGWRIKARLIEEIVLNSVETMLAGRVNALLGEMGFYIPPIEFGAYRGGVVPVVGLVSCERSEKERVVRVEAYSLTIRFAVAEAPDSERYCYAYVASVAAALGEDPTLGGAADRVELVGKEYSPPKYAGADWGIALLVRITTEGMGL